MHHLQGSIARNESSKVAFLSAIRSFHAYCNQYGGHMQGEDWARAEKDGGNQEDWFSVVVVIYSDNNNKTTVGHLYT